MKNIDIKKVKIVTDFSSERKKGSQIERALSAVGTPNLKICGENHKYGLLKRHGKESLKIKID